MQTKPSIPSASLDEVRQLLQQDRPADALEALNRCPQTGPAVQNARGVCLLRMGRAEAAVQVFRELVFPRGAFTIPDETPTVLRTNYATALLLAGNVVVGGTLLREVPDRHHPAVVRLKGAVRQWRRSLGWLRRLMLYVGGSPGRPFVTDFPPGDLLDEYAQEGPAAPRQRAA